MNFQVDSWNHCLLNIIAYTDPLLVNDRITNNKTTSAARQQSLSKQHWRATQERCFLCDPCQGVLNGTDLEFSQSCPCGGGVEYLHRDPASRKRRRNGKSQIWDSKIRSRVPRGSDPRMTALRASSNCKRQTRPLVRESAPRQQTSNCPTVIKIWS
jgi:hypothetical protein